MEEANRLAVMSERLLQMAAAGRTGGAGACGRAALLEKAARTVAPKAAARGVALEPVQADACTVQGEAALLESLMVNLADNAVKACGPGGSVRLCARRETGRLTLTVQDTGRGMDAETLAHIGEPFYRPDKARSPGTGRRGAGPCAVLPDRAEPWRGAVLYLRAGRGHHGRRNIYSLMTS